jgi:hypothetical protein
MAVDKSALDRWRSLEAAKVLVTLATYAKPDPTYIPVKNRSSRRWHAQVAGRDFELLLTGPKFWDTRQATGGGGAVDLVMHLTGSSFREASRLLQRHGL